MTATPKLTTIVGPTASGKTALAVALALATGAEIISGDSRQVYKGMDIGTGKDLGDYSVGGKHIPYHLIDIREAGYKYNVFEFHDDFMKTYSRLKSEGKNIVFCGGSGLYVESVLRGYALEPVPENKELRRRLEGKTLEELTAILANYKRLHNTTDVDTPKRAIRAIEIEEHYKTNGIARRSVPERVEAVVFGIMADRETRRTLISKRLANRLDNGLVDEVRGLLDAGISADDLKYYGLEYKFVTSYVLGEMPFAEMHSRLEIAIHQFAKRQMTWFRGMERRGIEINWLDYDMSMQEKLEAITNKINSLHAS